MYSSVNFDTYVHLGNHHDNQDREWFYHPQKFLLVASELTSVPIVLVFPECHMSGIRQYVAFVSDIFHLAYAFKIHPCCMYLSLFIITS